MAKPLVAIVGRPNVGKSTFFNKIAGRRISIVEDVPGVTRDRVYADVEWMGRRFSMVDTGGLDMRSEDVLLSQMRRQAEIAMDTADVICFFCDGRTGLTSEDEDVARAKVASAMAGTGTPSSRAVWVAQAPVPFWLAASTTTSTKGRPVAGSVCPRTSVVTSMR